MSVRAYKKILRWSLDVLRVLSLVLNLMIRFFLILKPSSHFRFSAGRSEVQGPARLDGSALRFQYVVGRALVAGSSSAQA